MKVYTLLLLLLTACATNRPAPINAPADGAEYYQPNQTVDLARKQILPDPTGGLGHAEDSDIRVTDIKLTASYTVVYMTFGKDPRDRNNAYASSSSISFSPNALLATPDGKRTYKLQKADGIPMTPYTREIKGDETLPFVLYFERLDPDVDSFDLFECKSENGNSCFNVVGLHVPKAAGSSATQN